MHAGQGVWYTSGGHTSLVPTLLQDVANWLHILFTKLAVHITSEFILFCTYKLFLYYLFNSTKNMPLGFLLRTRNYKFSNQQFLSL